MAIEGLYCVFLLLLQYSSILQLDRREQENGHQLSSDHRTMEVLGDDKSR